MNQSGRGGGLRAPSASLRNAGLQPTPITTPEGNGNTLHGPATGETSRGESGLERTQRGRGQGWFVVYADGPSLLRWSQAHTVTCVEQR